MSKYTIKLDLKKIGRECAEVRRSHGYTQREVAEELHMVRTSVSNFEMGNNNSASILAWYVLHGYSLLESIDISVEGV